MSEQTRLNININAQTSTALRGYAASEGITVTEAVRRLVNVGDFIVRAMNSGQKVLLKHESGTDHVVFGF